MAFRRAVVGGQLGDADWKGENDCGLVSKGSRGVSISNRLSLSLVMNTKPKRGSLYARQPSTASRSIVVVIAPNKSSPGSSRLLSMTCH